MATTVVSLNVAEITFAKLKIANGLQGSLFLVLILAHEAASRLFKKRKFGLSTELIM